MERKKTDTLILVLQDGLTNCVELAFLSPGGSERLIYLVATSGAFGKMKYPLTTW